MSETSGVSDALPRPNRRRWQPLRSGLLNLFRFDREEFHYEDGHLLLRGNNGTGKSRVLALQLPFLFDADVSPYRLEPDGDPAKRIEWNLLLGEHKDRLGYTWIELGRRIARSEAGERATPDDESLEDESLEDESLEDESLEDEYLTLGCGLSAVEGRGLVGKWFFVVPGRVGVDFSLEGAAGAPLTRRRLEEVLGATGEVFTAAKDYRRSIDRRLFGLGDARYEALMRLLIQLRQPQLARKLDEEGLSRALSDALPPPSEAILDDVAEAFGSLEADRQAVLDLAAATRGAESFLDVYRRYAEVLTRRRAEAVRVSHSQYEWSMRRLRAAEQTRDDAATRVTALAARQSRLETELDRLEVEVRTLEGSDEMRGKQALDATRRRAELAAAEARQAGERLDTVTAELETTRQRLAAARDGAARSRELARRGLDTARRAAARAGLERRGLRWWNALDDAFAAAEAEPASRSSEPAEDAVEQLERDLELRRAGIRRLERMASEIAHGESLLADAKEQLARATAEVDDMLEEQSRAVRERANALAELLHAYAAWRDGLRVLEPDPVEVLEEAMTAWSEDAEGQSEVQQSVERAVEQARRIVARHRAVVDSRLADQAREIDELEAQVDALESGAPILPPAVHTRGDPRRAERAGAPFWRLVDFRDDVPAPVRAAAEAALEAAGLLDAWVTPTGALLDPAEQDVVLSARAADGAREPAVAIDQILRLADDVDAVAVDPEVPRALLRRIGWGHDEGRVWVAPSGRFRVGPLHGSWAKEAPQYLGAAARGEERRRRLADLARQLDAARDRLASLREDRARLDDEAAAIDAERAAAPADEPVRVAAARVGAATRDLARVRGLQAQAEERVHQRRAALGEVIEARDRVARDLELEDHLDDLDGLQRGVDEYARALPSVLPALAGHATVAQALAAQEAEAESRRVERERLQQELDERRRLARRAAAEQETLEGTLGAGVADLLQRLETARRAHAERRREIDSTRQEEIELRTEAARAAERIEAEQGELARHEGERQTAIDELQSLAALRLLTLAAPSLEVGDAETWSVRRAVEVARSLDGLLDAVAADDAVWDRLQGRVHEQFRGLTEALLPYGYEPSLTMPSGVMVVRVPFQGQSKDVDAFRAALHEETGTRERVLAEREREILENHLLGEVSLHLHERLRAAEELVREMNAELASRPTSSGMRLRFAWLPRVDEIDSLRDARRLLLTDQRMRAPDENRFVGRFLHGLIDTERDAEQGSWRESLRSAFDYRAWHRFTIEQQQADGPWRRLTRRTHGTGSGGEKAIALTVPQFAAAAAHYRSARAEAPRLILLDEAFVGVDDSMRAQCMGLLAAFDLDFVMTSEREWGCYPTLPGLAIYQLARHPEIDAIGVTRWIWNGSERVRAAATETPRTTPEERETSAADHQVAIFDAGGA